MKPLGDTLSALAVQFAMLSLLAFGGANAVIPEIHRQAVEVNHWMTDQDFVSLFAISQTAPGPNVMISTLVGWKAAGLAAATTIKMAQPLIRRRPLSAAPFILAAFAGVGLMHFPLIWVLLALAPLSVAAAWRPRS